MANNTFSSDPVAGAGITTKNETEFVKLGTVVKVVSDIALVQGKFAMYVQASGIIGNSSYCTIALTSLNCLATSVASDGAGTAYCRNGSVAFADGEFGWVYIMYPNSVLGGET
jgi:hypothetical protein